MYQSDDEMFDDIHEGVESLRSIAQIQDIPLTQKAVASLQRLEAAVPAAKEELKAWREKLKESAVKAAQKTNEAVHDHPWVFTLSALGLGFLAGLILLGSNHEEESSVK